jgi:hypothetical protein
MKQTLRFLRRRDPQLFYGMGDWMVRPFMPVLSTSFLDLVVGPVLSVIDGAGIPPPSPPHDRQPAEHREGKG